MLTDKNENLVISYLTLRKVIGILGMLLPFVCLLGGSWLPGKAVPDSISAYYHTNMQDILVGLLVGVAMFLLTYNGYEKRDMIVATASGVAALGIAFFPCNCPNATVAEFGVFRLSGDTVDIFHYGSSAIFFLLLGINSFFLFTIGDKKNWTKSKSIRNAIYRVCGIIIFASLLTLGIMKVVLGGKALGATSWTLVFETVMLLAFGISWLVKGETLFKDKPGEERFDLTAAQQARR